MRSDWQLGMWVCMGMPIASNLTLHWHAFTCVACWQNLFSLDIRYHISCFGRCARFADVNVCVQPCCVCVLAHAGHEWGLWNTACQIQLHEHKYQAKKPSLPRIRLGVSLPQRMTSRRIRMTETEQQCNGLCLVCFVGVQTSKNIMLTAVLPCWWLHAAGDYKIASLNLGSAWFCECWFVGCSLCVTTVSWSLNVWSWSASTCMCWL